MTREDYLRRIELIDCADGSMGFSCLYLLAHDYMEDFQDFTMKEFFIDIIDEKEANEMLYDLVVNKGADVYSVWEFLENIRPWDDYFLLGQYDNLLHITPEDLACTLRNVIAQIKEDIEKENGKRKTDI